MKIPKIVNKTKFIILYDSLWGYDVFHSELENQIIKKIIFKIPINRISWGHTQRPYFCSFALNVHINNWILQISPKSIRLICCDFYFYITEKVNLERLKKLLNIQINIRNKETKNAISSFLRGKKEWNFVILKSLRE